MENEELKNGTNKEPLLDRILGNITLAAFIAIVVCGIFETPTGLFISITAAFALSLCIMPLIEYIRKVSLRNGKENIRRAFGICYIMILAGCIIFLTHRVIFSEAITKDRYYWIYDYIAWYLIVFFIVLKILDTARRIKVLMKEKAGLMRYAGSAVYSIFSVFFMFSFLVPRYYMPRRIIDLSIIKVPDKLIYSQVSEGSSKELNEKYLNSGTIEDGKFVELFQREMYNVKTENIRKLDKINFEFKNMKAKYMVISPFYSLKTDGSKADSGTYSRYYQMRIYENGEVVLYDFNLDSLGSFFRSPYDLFRLELSNEFIDEIKRAVNEKQ